MGRGIDGKGIEGKGLEGKGDGQAVRGTVEPCCCLRVVLGCCPLLSHVGIMHHHCLVAPCPSHVVVTCYYWLVAVCCCIWSLCHCSRSFSGCCLLNTTQLCIA